MAAFQGVDFSVENKSGPPLTSLYMKTKWSESKRRENKDKK